MRRGSNHPALSPPISLFLPQASQMISADPQVQQDEELGNHNRGSHPPGGSQLHTCKTIVDIGMSDMLSSASPAPEGLANGRLVGIVVDGCTEGKGEDNDGFGEGCRNAQGCVVSDFRDH